MTIGIDASRATKVQRTGTEWYSYYLIKNLANLDKETKFDLYTQNEPGSDLANLPPNFAFRTLRWPPRRLWTQVRLSLYLKSHPPDVLFVPAHTIPKFHPTKTVYTCHDIGFERLPHLYPYAERIYQKFSLKHAIKGASKIIAVSEFTKRELKDRYQIAEHRISVIYHGYNSEIFKPAPLTRANELARNLGLIPKRYLVYIGRLEAKKNTLGLIKAFHRLVKEKACRDLQLALVGSPGFQFGQIKNYLSSYQLNQSVKILGWLPLDILPDLLTSSAALVFPTFYEGFGLPILEAMACQTLVFASNLPSIKEIGQDLILYFDQNDPENIAQTIYHSLKQRDQIIKGLSPAWARNLQRFSWESCAKDTLALLKESPTGR